MNDRISNRWPAANLLLVVVLLGSTGCFGLNRGAPSQQHYVLGGGAPTAMATLVETTPSGDSTRLNIGLRRPQIASYLDAPFMVVRSGSHQIGFSELHRWAEDLGGGINRAVAGYLSQRGSFGAVDVAPWSPRENYAYLIQLNVLRFEGLIPEGVAPLQGQVQMGSVQQGEVQVMASWEIIRHEDGVVLARGVTDYREGGWRVGDYAGLVTLLDAGLGVLADDLVASIEALR
ncbi:MAG: PqiC family protein [Gemmatimonadota bacterium]